MLLGIIMLSLLTLGLAYVFIFLPISVLVALFSKENSEYTEHFTDKVNLTKLDKLTLSLGVAGNAVTITIGVVAFAVFITNMQFSREIYLQNLTEYDLRIGFWIITYSLLATFGIIHYLSKFKANYVISSLRKVLIVLSIVGLLIGGASIIFELQKKSSSNPGTLCGIGNVLSKTMGAVVPLATNEGSGTGFVVNQDGYIVTAYHVIENASNLRISTIEKEIPLSVLRVAPEYDLALLKSSETLHDYIGLDTDYKIADEVYSVGWPGNTFSAGTASVSAGVVSRVISSRDIALSNKKLPSSFELLQTDAAINPGNSGGPLISDCGVVGVIIWMSDSHELSEYGLASEQGISFAVSSKTVKEALGL